MAETATPAAPEQGQAGTGAVPGSTPQTAPQGQPAAEIDYEKIDLFKVPSFTKKFQPQYQAEINARRQAEQQAAFASQQIAALKQQMKEMEKAQAPDDWEKAQVELRQVTQERDEARQYAASIYAQQAEAQRQRDAYEAQQAQIEADLDMLAEQFETTKDKIRAKNPKDFKEAMAHAKELYAEARLALVEEKKVIEKKQAEQKEADMPDLGGGKTVPAVAGVYKEIRGAKTALELAKIAVREKQKEVPPGGKSRAGGTG